MKNKERVCFVFQSVSVTNPQQDVLHFTASQYIDSTINLGLVQVPKSILGGLLSQGMAHISSPLAMSFSALCFCVALFLTIVFLFHYGINVVNELFSTYPITRMMRGKKRTLPWNDFVKLSNLLVIVHVSRGWPSKEIWFTDSECDETLSLIVSPERQDNVFLVDHVPIVAKLSPRLEWVLPRSFLQSSRITYESIGITTSPRQPQSPAFVLDMGVETDVAEESAAPTKQRFGWGEDEFWRLVVRYCLPRFRFLRCSVSIAKLDSQLDGTEWQTLRALIQPCDRIWPFRCPKGPAYHCGNISGYVVLRGKQFVGGIVTSTQ